MATSKPPRRAKHARSRKKIVQSCKDRLKATGLVQRAMSFPCLVDGGLDKYRETANAVRIYRTIFRALNGVLTIGSAATATIMPPKKRRRKKGEQTKPKPPAPGAYRVFRSYNDAKQLIATTLGSLPGKQKYYELRSSFCAIVARLRDAGIINFGTHMFDSLRVRIAAEYDKKMVLPSGKKVSRSHIEVAGAFDPIPVKHLGMPIMRSSGRNYAELVEDERGIRMRIQWGHKTDAVDLVLKGEVQSGEKTFKRKPAWSLQYMLHKMATGEWAWQTPVLNLKDDGKMSLNIPFTKPAADGCLKSGSVAELSYMPTYGRDLWETKKDKMGTGTGKHDNLLYPLVLTQGERKFGIVASDVVADLNRYKMQRIHWEEHRAGRGRWPRRLRKPASEHIHNLADARKRRVRDANHAWSRQICNRARSWGCSTIKVFQFPDGATHGLTGDNEYPWCWHQLIGKFLTYKAEEYGMTVEVVESIHAEELAERMLNAEGDDSDTDFNGAIAATV